MLNVDFCKIKILHFSPFESPLVRREHLRQFAANSFIIVEIDPSQRQTLSLALIVSLSRSRTRFSLSHPSSSHFLTFCSVAAIPQPPLLTPNPPQPSLSIDIYFVLFEKRETQKANTE